MSAIDHTQDRPLNPGDPYYKWSEFDGNLSIFSECCGDYFSDSEEIVLRDYLLARHPLGVEVSA